MATPVNQGTDRPVQEEGKAITSTFLTSIGVFATQRAWDSPGYAGLLAFDLITNSHRDVFNGTVAAAGLKYGVFTVGGGLAAAKSATPLRSYLDDGFAGIWDESRLSPPQASDATPRMTWAWIKRADCIHDHAAATTGNTRYDLVHCAIVRTDLEASRDYKDAATGEKTTEADAVVAEQIAIDIQVTQGTEGAGSVTFPSIPSGRHVLYAVKVSDTEILEVDDFVIPAGVMKTTEMNPGGHIFLANTGWANAGGGIASSGAGSCYVSPPDGLRGNPSARLLGVRISHHLQSGDSVHLVDYPLAAGGSIADIYNSITPVTGGALDGLVDLRGYPSASTLPRPVHGQGASDRVANHHHFPAVKVTAVGAGSVVYGVTWYYIEG